MWNRTAEKTTETVIRAIDEALYSVNTPDQAKINISISCMGFPATKPRFLTTSGLYLLWPPIHLNLIPLFMFTFLVVQIVGPVFFYCPPMFLFILLLHEIVDEKQKKLRQGMKVMGLSVFLSFPFLPFPLPNVICDVKRIRCIGRPGSSPAKYSILSQPPFSSLLATFSNLVSPYPLSHLLQTNTHSFPLPLALPSLSTSQTSSRMWLLVVYF